VVAIDSSSASCPLVTLELTPRPIGAPMRVTLDLCEWQSIARELADAAEALGGCPTARRLRRRLHKS
jgi:hypothetical protein